MQGEAVRKLLDSLDYARRRANKEGIILTVLHMEALVALLRAAINHGLTDSLLSLVKGKNYGTRCVVWIPDKSGSVPLTYGFGSGSSPSCIWRPWWPCSGPPSTTG
jgi:hypothetical protein